MKDSSHKEQNKTPQFSFTPAGQDDIQTIHQLACQIWREHYPDIIGADTVEYMLKLMYSPEVIMKDMNSGLEYFIISYGTEKAGYFGISNKGDRIFLSRIYIMKKFRGRRIGHNAIEYICSITSDRGLSGVDLTVAKSNTASLEFYKSCGFTISDEIIKDIGSGHKMDDYVMSKAVSSLPEDKG